MVAPRVDPYSRYPGEWTPLLHHPKEQGDRVAFFERLSALDGSFLGLEHRSAKMHIAVTLVFDAAPLTLPDGRLAFDRIRSVLDARLHEVASSLSGSTATSRCGRCGSLRACW